MTLPIRNDVPVPETTTNAPIPWDNLQVGDSVLLPPPSSMLGLDASRKPVLNPTFVTVTQAHAREHGLRLGRTFEVHEVQENDKTFVGIWRTA